MPFIIAKLRFVLNGTIPSNSLMIWDYVLVQIIRLIVSITPKVILKITVIGLKNTPRCRTLVFLNGGMYTELDMRV